jgi:hypothetical protein
LEKNSLIRRALRATFSRHGRRAPAFSVEWLGLAAGRKALGQKHKKKI